jgi:type I restriction enzyme R subunit
MIKENKIEDDFIEKLQDLKYKYRPDIRDKESLELNFRQKFEKLNKVNLTNNEFTRLLEQIINPNAFKTSILLNGLIFGVSRI